MTKALITGGAGFIGHHLIDYILRYTDWDITIIDRLDISGNLNRLADIGAAKNHRVRFVYHDLKAPINEQLAHQIGRHNYILHLAAATHVDRSITEPLSFVYDNVVATCNVLDFARFMGCDLFLNFSTDEVFGPAPTGVAYKEWDRYKSGNPYAATKAGAEELAVSYANTYKIPMVITHTMNVIGERQHPEKYIPSTIIKVERGDEVIVHSDKTRTIPGSRFYIHAKHVADAVMFLVKRYADGSIESGDKFNIVGQQEVTNLEIAQMIAEALKKPLKYQMVDFHSSRPGHDLRYALDGTKLRDMGWVPPSSFKDALVSTVRWTLAHPEWVDDFFLPGEIRVATA